MAITLLGDFIKYLQERHHQLKAVLFDPSENNPRAIHLFVKLGAKPVGLFEKREILLLQFPFPKRLSLINKFSFLEKTGEW